MNSPTEQFRDAIQSAGLIAPADITPDGKLRRFSSSGKKTDDAGWYVLYGDGIPAGSYGDWRTGISQSWRADVGRALSPQEETAHQVRIEAMRREREAEDARRHEAARRDAETVWQAAKPVTDHPYLTRKGVQSYGLRVGHDGRLIIPLRDSGVIRSLQFIGPDGEKRFLTGGRVAGCYFSVGNPKDTAALCISEGVATGATLHEVTGYPVAIAFTAGNMLPVAKTLRAKFPDLRLIVCGDDDYRTEGNPGLTKATEAARAVGGLLAVPDFGDHRPEGATDFNDMAQQFGAEAVRRVITNASVASSIEAAIDDGLSWPDPLPLIVSHERLPYPTDALPGLLGEAVREVQAFVQCPVALAACTALSVLSVAAQGLVDVHRGEGLSGPVSLYFLVLADSGERKTSCDKIFSTVLDEWDAAQREARRMQIAEHAAKTRAWKATSEGIEGAIRDAARKNKPTEKLSRDLADNEANQPAPLFVPSVKHGDITPEELARTLATGWHSGAILSSEAGVIFGSHGMRSDSVMSNLSLLNILWDGGSVKIERKTSASFSLTGARLTLGLATQPDTVRAFFEATKGLARSSGFAARFLLAYPESTQGTRLYRDAGKLLNTEAYLHRIRQLLDTIPSINERGELQPAMLHLAPEAKTVWIKFYNDVEVELRANGELADVRDAASKCADQAARIAALFHVLTNGTTGAISSDHMQAAAKIATWHLYEARHILGEVALPKNLNSAARLDAWLIRCCREKNVTSVSTRDVQRTGPNCIRDKPDFDHALNELEQAGRVIVRADGRQKRVMVNPKLLTGDHGAT